MDDRNIKWGEVRLSSIFKEIPRGKVADLRNSDDGQTVIIAASGTNEGFSCFGNEDASYRNAMTISFNGVGTGTAFVHDYDFNLNSDCGVVVPIDDISIDALRFIAVAINMNKEKFNYGYKANENRMLRQTIMLPILKDGTPNFKYMEEFIRSREKVKVDEYRKYVKSIISELGEQVKISNLEDKEWKEFFVTDIFYPPKRGKRIVAENYVEGNLPVVSSAGGNNGVIAFAGNEEKVRIYEECLSVANGGVSAGFAFYHPYKFIATDHVTHFKGKNLNKYHYMFIGTVIRNQMHTKYDFSREMTDLRLEREKILLPIDKKGNPDYDYMEQFVKNTMIKQYESYLEHKSVKIS